MLVIGGIEPPLPPLLLQANSARLTTTSPALRRKPRPWTRPSNNSRPSSPPKDADRTVATCDSSANAVLVRNVSDTDDGWLPPRVTEPGENAQVVKAGKVPQLKDTD